MDRSHSHGRSVDPSHSRGRSIGQGQSVVKKARITIYHRDLSGLQPAEIKQNPSQPLSYYRDKLKVEWKEGVVDCVPYKLLNRGEDLDNVGVPINIDDPMEQLDENKPCGELGLQNFDIIVWKHPQRMIVVKFPKNIDKLLVLNTVQKNDEVSAKWSFLQNSDNSGNLVDTNLGGSSSVLDDKKKFGECGYRLEGNIYSQEMEYDSEETVHDTLYKLVQQFNVLHQRFFIIKVQRKNSDANADSGPEASTIDSGSVVDYYRSMNNGPALFCNDQPIILPPFLKEPIAKFEAIEFSFRQVEISIENPDGKSFSTCAQFCHVLLDMSKKSFCNMDISMQEAFLVEHETYQEYKSECDGDEDFLVSRGKLRKYAGDEFSTTTVGELVLEGCQEQLGGRFCNKNQVSVENLKLHYVKIRFRKIGECNVNVRLRIGHYVCHYVSAANPPGESLIDSVAIQKVTADKALQVRDSLFFRTIIGILNSTTEFDVQSVKVFWKRRLSSKKLLDKYKRPPAPQKKKAQELDEKLSQLICRDVVFTTCEQPTTIEDPADQNNQSDFEPFSYYPIRLADDVDTDVVGPYQIKMRGDAPYDLHFGEQEDIIIIGKNDDVHEIFKEASAKFVKFQEQQQCESRIDSGINSADKKKTVESGKNDKTVTKKKSEAKGIKLADSEIEFVDEDEELRMLYGVPREEEEEVPRRIPRRFQKRTVPDEESDEESEDRTPSQAPSLDSHVTKLYAGSTGGQSTRNLTTQNNYNSVLNMDPQNNDDRVFNMQSASMVNNSAWNNNGSTPVSSVINPASSVMNPVSGSDANAASSSGANAAITLGANVASSSRKNLTVQENPMAGFGEILASGAKIVSYRHMQERPGFTELLNSDTESSSESERRLKKRRKAKAAKAKKKNIAAATLPASSSSVGMESNSMNGTSINMMGMNSMNGNNMNGAMTNTNASLTNPGLDGSATLGLGNNSMFATFDGGNRGNHMSGTNTAFNNMFASGNTVNNVMPNPEAAANARAKRARRGGRGSSNRETSRDKVFKVVDQSTGEMKTASEHDLKYQYDDMMSEQELLELALAISKSQQTYEEERSSSSSNATETGGNGIQ